MQVKDTRPADRRTVELVEGLLSAAPVGGGTLRVVLSTTIRGVDKLRIERYTPKTQQGSGGGAQTP